VGEHDRVVIDIDHPAVRGGRLRDLVHAVHRGQPGADVKELPDADLIGQVPDHAHQELAVLDRRGPHHAARHHRDDSLRGGPVGRVVVLAAEVVVIHPGGARDIRAKFIRCLSHGPDSVITRPCLSWPAGGGR